MAVSRPRRPRTRATWDNAELYDRFMGKFSAVLAPQMAELAGVSPAQRALDVGCGPGALAGELARRLGPEAVTAIDPSEAFIAACVERNPGVSAHRGVAEALPFPDDTFDVTAAQLVVNFMKDPEAGLAEMVRVTRPGGVIVACDWFHWSGAPHGPFFHAARLLKNRRSRAMWLKRPGLIFQELGLVGIEETTLRACVTYESFEEWWAASTEGVGTSAGYAKKLDPEARAELRDLCRAELPEAPFTIEAGARAVRAVVP